MPNASKPKRSGYGFLSRCSSRQCVTLSVSHNRAPFQRPITKPVTAALGVLPPDMIDSWKKKRVEEILGNNSRGKYTHSNNHISRIKHSAPAPPPPPDPTYNIYDATPVPGARLSSLVSGKLLPQKAGDQTLLTMPLSAAHMVRSFIRAPIFLKAPAGAAGAEADWVMGRTATQMEKRQAPRSSDNAPGAANGDSAVGEARAGAKGAKGKAAPAKRGVMTAGIARKPTTAAVVTPTVRKKKLETKKPKGPVEAPRLPLMEKYMRRMYEDQSHDWNPFRQSVALEQHMAGIQSRSRGEVAGTTNHAVLMKMALFNAGNAENCIILAAASLGGSVVRTLRVGEAVMGDGESRSTYRQIFMLTHFLPDVQEKRWDEKIIRTNLTRASGEELEQYAAAIHPSGLLCAVSVGPTINVFDLGPAMMGQTVQSKLISVLQESSQPITRLMFSAHHFKESFLCSYDNSALRVWKAYSTETSKTFITPIGGAPAPYVVSASLLQSFHDPLPDLSQDYRIEWHLRGDCFVTYSSTVAKVWKFDSKNPSATQAPIFEHRALEGLIAVQFFPDVARDVLVVLSAQQKIRFVDLSRPDEFARVYSTISGVPWSGFIFHPQMPSLMYGVTPQRPSDGSAAVTAMIVNTQTDESELTEVYRTWWPVPEPRDKTAESLAKPATLFPKMRAMLCIDAETSLLCWMDAAKICITTCRFCPFFRADALE